MEDLHNLILNADSYKASHWLQYPPWRRRHALVYEDQNARDPEWEDMLQPVWRDGALLREENLATIRAWSEETGARIRSSWTLD